MNLISIEGLIGVGKSELAKSIARSLDCNLVQEPVETNPYLIDFYKDPSRWSFPMQCWLLLNAYKQHKNIQELQLTSVLDRSIFGNNIFVKMHFMDGTLSQRDYETYSALCDSLSGELLAPHTTIFLEADPKVCLERIKLRGRECEQNITLDYLEALQERHYELAEDLKALEVNVVRLDWNKFQATEEVIDRAGLDQFRRVREGSRV